SRYFVGLPTPAGAGTVCSILFFAPDAEWRQWMQVVTLMAMMVVGPRMVSTFRYVSFRKLDMRRRWSYRAFVPVAAIILVIVFEPRATFLGLAALSTPWGPLAYLWGRLRRRPAEEPPAPAADDGPGSHL